MKTREFHDEVCSALMDCGAVPPEVMLPDGYNGTRADAVFVAERAIVEVKSISKDQASKDEIGRRVAQLFKRWGEKASIQELTPTMRHELEAVIAPRVTKDMRDANRQIRETAKAMGWSESYGIVIFIVPSSFRVDPGLIARLSWHLVIRREDAVPHIDVVMAIVAHAEDQPLALFRPMACAAFPREDLPLPKHLSRRISEAWYAHYCGKTGLPLIPKEGGVAEFMQMYKLRPLK